MTINTEAINIFSEVADKDVCIYYDADWNGVDFYGCTGAFYIDVDLSHDGTECYAFHVCEDTTFIEQFAEFVLRLKHFFSHEDCKKIVDHLMGGLYSNSLDKLKGANNE